MSDKSANNVEITSTSPQTEESITDKELDELVEIFAKPKPKSLLSQFYSTFPNTDQRQEADAKGMKEDNTGGDDWGKIGDPASRGSTRQEIRVIDPSPLSSDSSPTPHSQEDGKVTSFPRNSAPAPSRRLNKASFRRGSCSGLLLQEPEEIASGPRCSYTSGGSFLVGTPRDSSEQQESQSASSGLAFLRDLNNLKPEGDEAMSEQSTPRQEYKSFISFSVSEGLRKLLASYVDEAQKDTLDELIDGLENEINATCSPDEKANCKELDRMARETNDITDYLKKMNALLVRSDYAQATLGDINKAIGGQLLNQPLNDSMFGAEEQVGGAINSQVNIFKMMNSPTPQTSPIPSSLNFSFPSTSAATSQSQTDARETKDAKSQGGNDGQAFTKSSLTQWTPRFSGSSQITLVAERETDINTTLSDLNPRQESTEQQEPAPAARSRSPSPHG